MNIPSDLQLIDFPKNVADSVKIAINVQKGTFDEIISQQYGHSANVLLLKEIVKSSGTLIDIGANIGTIALPLARGGCNVLAIELLPSNIQKLMTAVLANDFSNTRVVQAGVSSSDGLLHYSGTEAWGSVTSEGAEAVRLKLDTLWRHITLADPKFLRKPLTIKIDVEGHEAEVLKGADAVIREHRPFILFESIDWPGDAGAPAIEAKRLLVERDYTLLLIRNQILVPRTVDQIQEGLVSDFIAVPKERAAEFDSCISTFAIRELTLGEVAEWMTDLLPWADVHKLHILKVVKKYGENHSLAIFQDTLHSLMSEENEEIGDGATILLKTLT